VANDGETPTVIQRLAVYAVVRSSRGLLLAQNSALTNAPGTWGLAGGGVDAAELPEDALHREVWEETGQLVTLDGLETVTTRHWVGRAPHGRLEDFHAVRVVYRATCLEPSDPVVHDANGTTSAAAWMSGQEILKLELAPGTRDVILAVIDGAG
jgi:8-oxo-dGTP pyrophosphatase MutT (NUDIX family)